MNRFFIPPTCIQGAVVHFPAETARQMSAVLRLHAGEQVVVLDNGKEALEYRVELTTVSTSAAEGRVVSVQPCLAEPRARVWMYLCLTQREKFEWMLQKCTEVGAAGFTPLVSMRSLVRATSEAANKLERWQKIVTEAAEQCGRGRIPLVTSAQSWASGLAMAQQQAVRLIPWEEQIEGGLAVSIPANTQSVAIIIGPEGGLDGREVAEAQTAGFVPVSLGKRILRTETAAVVGLTLTLAALGDMA